MERGGGACESGRRSDDARRSLGERAIARLVPGFLLDFLALATLRTVGPIPSSLVPGIAQTATLLITLALAAVGLSVDLAGLRSAGARPIALGAALWAVVTILSLATQVLGLG